MHFYPGQKIECVQTVKSNRKFEKNYPLVILPKAGHSYTVLGIETYSDHFGLVLKGYEGIVCKCGCGSKIAFYPEHFRPVVEH